MPDVSLSIPDGSPWWVLPDDMARTYTEELRREIGPQHPLFPRLRTLRVVAKCDASDDVIVEDLTEADPVYLVHLTWAGLYDRIPDRFPAFGPVPLDALDRLLAEDG